MGVLDGAEPRGERNAREPFSGGRSGPNPLIARATGLSQAHWSFVRRGVRVPHRRHWAVFSELGKTCEQ